MKRPRGRPTLGEGEKRKMRAFKLPPDLLDEVDEHIPRGERSRIVEACLRAEVKRRKKVQEGGAE